MRRIHEHEYTSRNVSAAKPEHNMHQRTLKPGATPSQQVHFLHQRYSKQPLRGILQQLYYIMDCTKNSTQDCTD